MLCINISSVTRALIGSPILSLTFESYNNVNLLYFYHTEMLDVKIISLTSYWIEKETYK